MSYFVAEAIKERLLEISEDKEDLLTAQERLKEAKFISHKEISRFLVKRGIRH